MNKILIVLTGGTIGSETKNNVINVAKNNHLKKFLKLNSEKELNYKIIQPVNILSENSMPSDWNKIVQSIRKNWKNDFSGIIITYGTDTLAYAASAFSHYFFNFNKPIVFVSSDRPLIDKKASGRFNLISAIKFIDKEKIPGIFVAYKNPNENFVSFYLGSDVEQINNYDNKLNSITRTTFCKYNKKFIYTKNNSNGKNISFKKFNKDLKFSNKILIIHPYPGINYGYFNLSKNKPKAVLHSLYHSGTASTRNINKEILSLKNFQKICKKKKIPVFLAPIIKKKNIYKSLQIILQSGVKTLEGVTLENAYAKLSLAFGSFKTKEKIFKFLNKN